MRAVLVLPLAALLSLAACARDRSAPGLYRSYCQRCHGPNGEGPKRPVRLYPHLDLRSSPMVLRGDRAAVFVLQRVDDVLHPPFIAIDRTCPIDAVAGGIALVKRWC